jgi:hypothetical protein
MIKLAQQKKVYEQTLIKEKQTAQALANSKNSYS